MSAARGRLEEQSTIANGRPASVCLTPHSGASVACMGFAGLQLERAVPDFQWGGAFAGRPVHSLLVRDLPQFWYLRGLPDLAPGPRPDIPGSAAALRELLAGLNHDRLVVFGASTGGFAALLYGALLGADEVHAFSPITRLPYRKWYEVPRLAARGEWGLVRLHARLRLQPPSVRRYFDLRPLLAGDNGRTVYHIYYGDGHWRDAHNARHLAGLPRVELHAIDTPDHGTAPYLKRAGRLTAILDQALAEQSRSLVVS